jgi:3-hydroxyacyl-CoA dehydrogenase
MPTGSPIRVERSGDVVVLTLQNPPVNTLVQPVREALHRALDAAALDPSVTAVVIAGAPQFSAGADLAEFDSGQALASPTLHGDLAGLLDSLRVPSVAAITGVALGGGLELALACSARVASPGATLGLPETTLGFMPGAGGTQRLPRAVGIERGLNLIVSGRSIDAATAAEWGLVDEVADEPVAAAVRYAERLAAAGERPRLRDVAVSDPAAPAFVDIALRDARRARRGQGVLFALEAVGAAASVPFDEGMALEFALFERLARTPEAKAARYRFLSDRAGGKPSTAVALPASVAVIGAGTMGRGIAQSFLAAGIPATLIDTDRDRVDAGAAAIRSSLDDAVGRGRLSPDKRDAQSGLLTAAVGLAAAAGADLVIEAVFENLAVKLDVFRELDRVAGPDAVLASNTSSLDLDDIAAATGRPGSVVGMHFFSPANVMKLVEVVDGAATTTRSLDTALAVARRLGKTPVVSKVGPGFIGNRIFDQYLRQANLLLLSGATPQQVDTALQAWGMAMGPFAVLDLVGNDVAWQARTERGDTDPAWTIANALCEAGSFGRKTGTGWYSYAGDKPVPNPDLALPGGPGVPDEEIALRCVLAMVNEAAAVLAEGIAGSSRDVDTVMTKGYGFPAGRGGPWFFAESLGFNHVVASMRSWRDETGDAFWEPHPTLVQLGESA